ncbi:MAG: glycosyltransferase family A protein [Chthoniobacter sp.]
MTAVIRGHCSLSLASLVSAIIHLPQPIGCPNARNVGIKACLTSYVVMLDHDDLLRAGYLAAMISWVAERDLRCAAATLHYIGESPARVGMLVSRHSDFVMPSGFFSEIKLLAEIGYFPDSCGDDLLLFRAIKKITSLTTCPQAGVLYRIHPQAESSRNTYLWWAFLATFSAL